MAAVAVLSVSDREFRSQVLQHDAPVVVAFRAVWCAASQEMAPVIDEVASGLEDRAKVVVIDVDSDPQANKICRQYNVRRLPVTMVFREGRVVDFIGGTASVDNVAEMISQQLRPVLDVSEYNFEAEVLSSRMPVLVYVAAAWCGASRELAPAVESAAERFRGQAKVVRLEYGDANAALCARYGFLRVPTLAVFYGGKVQDQIFGSMEAKTRADGVARMLDQFVL